MLPLERDKSFSVCHHTKNTLSRSRTINRHEWEDSYFLPLTGQLNVPGWEELKKRKNPITFNSVKFCFPCYDPKHKRYLHSFSWYTLVTAFITPILSLSERLCHEKHTLDTVSMSSSTFWKQSMTYLLFSLKKERITMAQWGLELKGIYEQTNLLISTTN